MYGPDGPTCRVNDGQQVLEDLGFDGASIATDAGILVAMWVFFRITCYIVLLMRTRKQTVNA